MCITPPYSCMYANSFAILMISGSWSKEVHVVWIYSSDYLIICLGTIVHDFISKSVLSPKLQSSLSSDY